MPFANEPYDEAPFTDAFLISERITLVGSGWHNGRHRRTHDHRLRPDGVTVVCGEERYEGEPAHDLENPPGGIEAELTDGTTIRLIPDRQVVVYVGDTYPTCWQHEGTYTVTFGGDPGPGIKTGRYFVLGGSLDLE